MPLQAEIKSRSVLGATELTLLAPIKPGLVPAQDTRSYVTRARVVLATVHALGVSRREIDPTPAIAEVADRIKAIRSFRLAVVDELIQPKVLLSVSFDGGWEPYMRKIWRDLGPLLDLIFCNCQGYPISRLHGCAEYIDWVRRQQVETRFYYEDSPLTVADVQLLREQAAGPMAAPATTTRGLVDQARSALVGLYRLTELFPPGSEDGDVPLAAAQLLLEDLFSFVGPLPAGTWLTPTEEAAWSWFSTVPSSRGKAQGPSQVDRNNVQIGILERLADRWMGCLALVELDNAQAAVNLIDKLKEQHLLSAAARPFELEREIVANLAFTWAGLERLGLDEGTLRSFPQEFQEGMAQRASILGDLLHNHSRYWTLPAPYASGEKAPVSLTRVHAVVQFLCKPGHAAAAGDPWQAHQNGALTSVVDWLHRNLASAGRVVTVQPMQRYVDNAGRTAGHFRFADGLSQPALPGTPGALPGDIVEPGDLLLGYRNTLGDDPLTGPLWKDSSFVVLRKLRQYADRVDTQVPATVDAEALMGRQRDGSNLITGLHDNSFDYGTDPTGAQCPLHSHVRRANPRATRPDLKHLPRLLRRGMSYGERYEPRNATDERGLMFIAYNASIAEQFELIQGWLAGGNSSGPGSYSGLRDPFLGVRREGDPTRYPLPAGAVATLRADEPLVTLQWGLYAFVPSIAALEELRRIAVRRVEDDRVTDVKSPPARIQPDVVRRVRERREAERAALAAKGAALISRLQQAERLLGQAAARDQWKTVIEDAGARAAGLQQAVWAAIRLVHGGVLRTPYGVLVASQTLVNDVFTNAHGHYTVSGYNVRLSKSFGEIYLGQDLGNGYGKEAADANAAIMAVTEAQAFDSAYGVTQALLTRLAPLGTERTLELRDLTDGLLADFCLAWFGLPDGKFVPRGGWHWRNAVAPAVCPGSFYAPSRYTFQPQPGEAVRDLARDDGQKLRAQVTNFVQAVQGQPASLGTLGQALFAALLPAPHTPAKIERFATTLIGVMMGFLPTVDGVLRGVINEWIQEGTLWAHQAALARACGSAAMTLKAAKQALEEPLLRSLHRRPVPEIVWRTVQQPHDLGAGPSAVALRPGDIVVVGIASAMQEALADENLDRNLVFGGQRQLGAQPQPQPQPQPLHACPGQEMAWGVMLGFLAGLLERNDLRPAASAQALRFGV